jgi:dUTP pyrophosphatase
MSGYQRGLIVEIEFMLVGGAVADFIPRKATSGSAGVDLRANVYNEIEIGCDETAMIGTGIAMHISDPRYAGIIVPRSGLGAKSGIVLGNGTGVVDSDYTGEIMVCLWNRSNVPYVIGPLQRIAQLLIMPVVEPHLRLVSSFSTDQSSKRGKGGFGSTGVN